MSKQAKNGILVLKIRGSSSVGKATSFQADGCGFDSHLTLQCKSFPGKALYACVCIRMAMARDNSLVIYLTEKNGTFILICQHVIDGVIVTKEE